MPAPAHPRHPNGHDDDSLTPEISLMAIGERFQRYLVADALHQHHHPRQISLGERSSSRRSRRPRTTDVAVQGLLGQSPASRILHKWW